MTQDELKAAYERFDRMSDDEIERLDIVCTALQDFISQDRSEWPPMIFLPNRIAAMLAVEALKSWHQAEAERT